MLVHAPCRPGEHIDESQPIEPAWAYPKSKAAAEEVIRAEHGRIPYVLLHLAGLYDERTSVPTMAHQMARIYERDFQSHLYSGSTLVGQSMVHRDDMTDAFRRTVDRRKSLPPDAAILIGEPDPMGYEALQDELGYLIHGEKEWPTLRAAQDRRRRGRLGAGQTRADRPRRDRPGRSALRQAVHGQDGRRPLRARHQRARELLGWEPRHRLKDELPKMVADAEGRSGWLVQGQWHHAARLDRRSGRRRANIPRSCAPATRPR